MTEARTVRVEKKLSLTMVVVVAVMTMEKEFYVARDVWQVTILMLNLSKLFY